MQIYVYRYMFIYTYNSSTFPRPSICFFTHKKIRLLLSSEHLAHGTAKARFWPCFSGELKCFKLFLVAGKRYLKPACAGR